jgi:hypothetical protein
MRSCPSISGGIAVGNGHDFYVREVHSGKGIS